MPVKTFRPLTPSTRYITIASFDEITKTKPEKNLVRIRKKTGGRNCYGRITSRGIGGGHKQKIRIVDFKRNKHGVEAKVAAIEYDPRRTARLALLEYKDGEKRYIIAPNGLTVGARIISGPSAPPETGNSIPLRSVPVLKWFAPPEARPLLCRAMRVMRRFACPLVKSAESTRIATRPLARSAIPSMKMSYWAKRDGVGIVAFAPSAAPWPRILWIIRWVAAQARLPAAAIPSRPGA